MAGPELRRLRMEVHAKIDPIWKSGVKSRKEVYNIISRNIGKRYHTGESDEEMCRRILDMPI